MLEEQRLAHPVDSIEQVIEVEDLLSAQQAVKQIGVSGEVKAYIVDLVDATRKHAEIYLGASPRGSLALYRTAQARAALLGRDYVIPDDIKQMAIPALAHRLIVGSAARIRDVDARAVIGEVLSNVPVPGGEIA